MSKKGNYRPSKLEQIQAIQAMNHPGYEHTGTRRDPKGSTALHPMSSPSGLHYYRFKAKNSNVHVHLFPSARDGEARNFSDKAIPELSGIRSGIDTLHLDDYQDKVINLRPVTQVIGGRRHFVLLVELTEGNQLVRQIKIDPKSAAFNWLLAYPLEKTYLGSLFKRKSANQPPLEEINTGQQKFFDDYSCGMYNAAYMVALLNLGEQLFTLSTQEISQYLTTVVHKDSFLHHEQLYQQARQTPLILPRDGPKNNEANQAPSHSSSTIFFNVKLKLAKLVLAKLMPELEDTLNKNNDNLSLNESKKNISQLSKAWHSHQIKGWSKLLHPITWIRQIIAKWTINTLKQEWVAAQAKEISLNELSASASVDNDNHSDVQFILKQLGKGLTSVQLPRSELRNKPSNNQTRLERKQWKATKYQKIFQQESVNIQNNSPKENVALAQLKAKHQLLEAEIQTEQSESDILIPNQTNPSSR